MPFASAASVPGLMARCWSAHAAVAVRRGSTTINAPPRARCVSKYCMSGGIVSAMFAPASRIAVACVRSCSGNGRPRSMPSAIVDAAAPDDMQKRPL